MPEQEKQFPVCDIRFFLFEKKTEENIKEFFKRWKKSYIKIYQSKLIMNSIDRLDYPEVINIF